MPRTRAACVLRETTSNKDLITAKDVNSCVSSYMCSLRYMKKIIPLTVYNIIYNRMDVNENLFVDRTVCEISFKMFTSKISNSLITDVYYWCKGITDAIEKKYLREMHLLFQDQSDNRIIENYKYTFAYQDGEPDTSNIPRSEDIIKHTRLLFETIQSLSDYTKMSSNVKVIMEVVLSEDITPQIYVPPHFEKPFNNTPFSAQIFEKSEFTTIGHLKTGYHKFKCAAKGLMFGNMLESEYESININKEDLIENEPLNKGSNVMENKNTEKNIMESESLSLVECDPDEIISRCSDTNDKELQTYSSSFVQLYVNNDTDENKSKQCYPHYNIYCSREEELLPPNIILDDVIFHCTCNIQAHIGFTMKIKCTICSKYQHLICIGYIKLTSIEKPYICAHCHQEKANPNIFNQTSGNWKFISGCRLIIYYSYEYKELPYELLHRLDDKNRKSILDVMKTRNILQNYLRNRKCTLNRENLIILMPQLFFDFSLPQSMLLGETQDVQLFK